jgi:hypothetical protein
MRPFHLAATAALGVAVWRAAALIILFSRTDSTGSALTIKVLLACLGIVFLACGLLVLRKIPSRVALLFAGFCICSGLHWGGPLELASGPLRTGLLLFYLLVSSFLGSTLLLRFAMKFPVSRAANRPVLVRILYGPVIVATVLAVVYLASPLDSDFRAGIEGLFLALHAIVSNLFSVVALVLLTSDIFRRLLTPAQKRYVGLMLAGMLTAWLPYLVASSVGVETDPWNLTVVALPVSFVIALFGIEKTRPGGEDHA